MLNTLVNKLSIHNGLQSVLFVPSVVKNPLKAHVNGRIVYKGVQHDPSWMQVNWLWIPMHRFTATWAIPWTSPMRCVLYISTKATVCPSFLPVVSIIVINRWRCIMPYILCHVVSTSLVMCYTWLRIWLILCLNLLKNWMKVAPLWHSEDNVNKTWPNWYQQQNIQENQETPRD